MRVSIQLLMDARVIAEGSVPDSFIGPDKRTDVKLEPSELAVASGYMNAHTFLVVKLAPTGNAGNTSNGG